MTKRERIMAAVKGNSVDRVPVSFFGHNHVAERSTDTLVRNLLEQDNAFGWDFIKIQLPNTYYGQAWGCKYGWDPNTSPTEGWITEKGVVTKADDLKKIKPLNPKEGVIGEQLKVPKLLRSSLKRDIPLVHTIFTPLTVIKRLTGTKIRTSTEANLTKQLMGRDPDAMHQALTAVSQTFSDYAREAVRSGADGIFMTTTAWSLDTISKEEYMMFGCPYELPIFEAANEEGATLNIMHLCRENIMLDLFTDFPIQVISYDAKSPRNPTLKEALSKTNKAIWGGIDHETTLLNGQPKDIVAEVHKVLDDTNDERLILGPGCSISPLTPPANLQAVKDAVFTWENNKYKSENKLN